MKLRLHFILLMMVSALFSYGQITSVGIIGSATPTGWDSDTDMIQNPDSSHLWSVSITLTGAEAKFRANDAWDINWGAKDFPKGTGVQGGSNIPVYAGDYIVTFNSNTGEYYFDVDSDIGIIGSATPGGWDADTDLYIDQTDTNKYYATMVLKSGEAKFRQNDAWAVNWGAIDFPTGTATQDGPNIPIATAGKYLINFNKATGEYKFEEQKDYEAIGLIGSATAGGWDTDTDLTRDGSNPDEWKGKVDLIVGEVKFRANRAWAISWGSADFPKGIATETGPNIAVNEAGKYQVSFNTKTGEFDFKIIKPYATIGIIGSATPGGWDNDTDMIKDDSDPTLWKLRVKLVTGEAKFRSDNAWDVNWGSADFPKGIAEQDGPNIPVPAGDYKISFNTLTGEYNFEAVIEFEKISIVGEAGPFGDWPASGDNGARDAYLTKSPTDPNSWSMASVTLTDPKSGGGIKFRAETDWKVNWGSEAWPVGIGTQDGKNILCVAGTYKVSFKSDTGEYGFAEPNATYDVLSDATISVYPNPTTSYINIEVKEASIKGADTKVTIFDNTGKVVYLNNLALDRLSIDASRFNSGNYFIQLINNKYIVGKQVSVIR